MCNAISTKTIPGTIKNHTQYFSSAVLCAMSSVDSEHITEPLGHLSAIIMHIYVSCPHPFQNDCIYPS